jgi:hypothetical protein
MLLREHFGIKRRTDGRDWLLLCLDLARLHLPFYKPLVRSRGHPSFWTEDEFVNLLVAVHRERVLNRCPTDTAALAAVALRKGSRYYGRDLSFSSVRTRYYEARGLLRTRPDFARRIEELIRPIDELAAFATAPRAVQITER